MALFHSENMRAHFSQTPTVGRLNDAPLCDRVVNYLVRGHLNSLSSETDTETLVCGRRDSNPQIRGRMAVLKTAAFTVSPRPQKWGASRPPDASPEATQPDPTHHDPANCHLSAYSYTYSWRARASNNDTVCHVAPPIRTELAVLFNEVLNGAGVGLNPSPRPGNWAGRVGPEGRVVQHVTLHL